VGPSRDVTVITGAAPVVALVLSSRGVAMEGWLLILAFLGAAWLIFSD